MNTLKMKTVRGLLALVLGAPLAQAQTADLPNKLDALMQEYVSKRLFSGVVLLAKEDKVLYHKAFGLADRERGIAARPETNFSIASVGKPFTATMVMRLVQAGKLDIRRTVNDYLPEWKVPAGDRITLEQLLTHTGATGNYMLHPDYEELTGKRQSIEAVMPLVVSRIRPDAERGTKFQYSNSGYILLGKICEKVTGRSYPELLSELIYQPAGMTNSYLQPKGLPADLEALPYQTFTEKAYKAIPVGHDPALPDGGMYSNARDLWRFARWVQTQLPADLRETMWTPRSQRSKTAQYGYGWTISQFQNKTAISHDGGGNGASAELRLIPEDGYTVVVLINRRLDPKEIARQILQVAYTGQAEPVQKEFLTAFLEDIERHGLPAVGDRLPAIAQDGYGTKPRPGDYIDVFNALNDLGRHQQALDLASKLEPLYPGQAWLFEGIGDAYLGLKDRQKAREAFEKALQLDPNNFWAKAMLDKMALK